VIGLSYEEKRVLRLVPGAMTFSEQKYELIRYVNENSLSLYEPMTQIMLESRGLLRKRL
jgi:hypothetical protein